MANHDVMLKSESLFFIVDGDLEPARQRAAGLFALDTRYLKGISAEIDGQPLERLSATIHNAASATITRANSTIELENGKTLLPHVIAVEERIALDSSLHIAWVLKNYSQSSITAKLNLTVAADFKDIFEIRGFDQEDRGSLLPPHTNPQSVTLRYKDIENSLLETVVTFDRAPDFEIRHWTAEHPDVLVTMLPGHDDARWEHSEIHEVFVNAAFEFELAPQQQWDLNATATPTLATAITIASTPIVVRYSQSRRATTETDDPFFNRLLDQSIADLNSLFTHFPNGDLIAGGIPWYVAPFGRDSLITGLQTLHIAPRDAEGTLRVLASLQGEEEYEWNEEQPGKILHEMRYGEMARSKQVPHSPYYGSIDATPLFIWLFAETIAWTSNDNLYLDLLQNVKRALQWIEQYGDLDGDGLVEYRSDPGVSKHLRHQSWKDSHDSLHHVDGTPALGNIAPVEVQGYVYAAYRRLAEVTRAFGDFAFAEQLDERAALLKQRFEEAFWLEEEQFYAQALDGEKRAVRTITSNPGHLLLTDLPDKNRSAAVVARLRCPDMASGWGIRTLSSSARTYNPMSYHNGSVWPHDNSLIAAGCHRTGAVLPGNAIFESLYEVGRRADDSRLSELHCGFSRSGAATDAPVPYDVACSPQAWAAGCYPLLVRSALGLEADLNRRQLTVDPHLPAFLGEVTIRNMNALGMSGWIRVSRDRDDYRIESGGFPLVRREESHVSHDSG